MFVATCFYLSFIISQLLLSRVKLTKCIPSILRYSCNHIICSGLSILFFYAPGNKVWTFEKFVFVIEAFSCDFKIDCILVGKFNIFISWSPICTPCAGINGNCKYFTAALIYNNVESGNPNWTPPIRVKALDKETVYFNCRLDVGVTNFNDIDEFVFVNKQMKDRESKIPIHHLRKNPKKWQLTVKCIRHQLCHI